MSSVTTSAGAGARRHAEPLASVLSAPLILGASVSANLGTASPGRRAALRYTTPDRITTLAQNGMPGRLMAPRVTPRLLADHSVVIALDLFFWDSILPNPAESLRALEDMEAKARAAGIPLILGDVPGLMPVLQPGRPALNARIHALSRANPSCHVFGWDAWHQQVLRDGGLLVGGRHYTLRQLLPDGLHLGDVAGEYLADRLHALLAAGH